VSAAAGNKGVALSDGSAHVPTQPLGAGWDASGFPPDREPMRPPPLAGGLGSF
jgi:hypothetical protein